ncbi:MAG: flavin reductase family protein, partial [Planctomycetota bacterium]
MRTRKARRRGAVSASAKSPGARGAHRRSSSADARDRDDARGLRVVRFTSLSADPPSVLVCLKADTNIAQAVSANGVFCVNILPEDAEEVAKRFAGMFDRDQPNRFAGVEVSETEFGPRLARATSFTCSLTHRHVHGSHAICIGDVTG